MLHVLSFVTSNVLGFINLIHLKKKKTHGTKRCLLNRRRVSSGGPLLHLNANNLCVSSHVKVLVLNVTQSVGKVHHVAIGKLDVKLLVVEIDEKLMGGGTKTTKTVYL